MMIPDQNPDFLSDMHTPPALSQILPDARLFGDASLTAAQVLKAISETRGHLDAFEIALASSESNAEKFVENICSESDERRAEIHGYLVNFYNEKVRELHFLRTAFDIAEQTPMWRANTPLLREHRRHVLRLFVRSQVLAEHFVLSIRQTLPQEFIKVSAQENPSRLDLLEKESDNESSFTYDIDRMQAALEGGGDILPSDVSSFEEFDKWMTR